jgi:hypothetical protein
MTCATPFEHLARLSRASRRVALQARCTVDEAVAIMNQCVQASGQRLDDIVLAVLEERIRFDADQRSTTSRTPTEAR